VELVVAEEERELLEHRGALAVRDAVEVREGLVGVGNRHLDRMRGDELVLPVAPLLLAGEEGPPAPVEARRILDRPGRRPGGEALVQPEPVPPAHRHEVSEPHVRHLVQDRVGAVALLVLRDLRAAHVPLGEGHRRDVLHRSRVEGRHDDLVVLRVGIGMAEAPAVELEPLARDLEPLVVLDEGRERLAREEPDRDAARIARPRGIGPGVQREDVGAEDGGRREAPGVAAAPARHLARQRVRDHRPVGGSLDGELVGGLEVRLVEAREHLVGVVGLEVRVGVDARVDGIHEAMEAVAGRAVGVREGDLDAVAAGAELGGREPQPAAPFTESSRISPSRKSTARSPCAPRARSKSRTTRPWYCSWSASRSKRRA
jgi:hypothetical protein